MNLEVLYNIAIIIWYIIFAIVFTQIYVRFYREHSYQFHEKYLNTIPQFINPLCLSMLLYHKIDVASITATTFFLIFKGHLRIEEIKGEKYLVNNGDNEKLSKSQRCIWYLLINVIGDERKVKIRDIESYCNSKKGISEFQFSYAMWMRSSVKEGTKYPYYESKMCYPRVKFVWVSGTIIMILNMIFGFHNLFGYIAFIIGLILLMMFLAADKRTIEANESYHKWQAFKRYLTDNDTFGCDNNIKKTFLMYGIILKVPNITKKFEFNDIEDLRNIERALNKCYHKTKVGVVKWNTF